MKTLKDILIVILLAVLVVMACVQQTPHLRYRLRSILKAVQMEGGLVYPDGGLVPTHGGLGRSDLQRLNAASAILLVHKRPRGPIIRGTGVFVSDNILITAKHLVTGRIGLSDVKITGPNGVTYTTMEILEDADDDLAVVIIRGRCGPWLDLGPWPSLGDDVICIGTPLDNPPQSITTWGRVSSENRDNTFIYTSFVWPGCSGGPVIVNGAVAGITVQRLPGTDSLGFAVPIDRLDPSLVARIR